MRSRVFFAALSVLPAIAVAQAPATDVAKFDPKEWDVPYGPEGRPRDPYADPQGRVRCSCRWLRWLHWLR